MDKKFDLTKPLFTKDGRPVRLVCEDRYLSDGTVGPLLMGLVRKQASLNPNLLDEDLCYWWPQGWAYRGVSGTLGRIIPPTSDKDSLTNTPPPLRQVGYYNVYKDVKDRLYMGSAENSRVEADREQARITRSMLRISQRVGVVKVELVEGQYDE